MLDGYICTRSCNCAAFISYCNSQEVKIIENETGLRMWAFKDCVENRNIYDKYKTSVVNNEKLFVDLIKFNKIIRYLKNISKDYK